MPPLPQMDSRSPYQRHCDRWRNGCGSDECSRAKQVVFARGAIPCDVLFIGEAPGESEDSLGLPFKGPAGELLQRIIEQSVPTDIRWAIYNVVGCIPRDAEGLKSGEPSHEQILHCRPRTEEFITIARPSLIVTVGKTSHHYLDQSYAHCVQITRPVPQVWIKHPAAILRETVASRGLSVQRCVVQVTNALQTMRDAMREAGGKITIEPTLPPRRSPPRREEDIPF